MSEIEEVVRTFVDAINRADETALESILHDDFVDHSAAPSNGADRDAFISQKLRQLRASFPDLHLVIEDVLEAGQRVSFRWRLTGTNHGDFAGREATGRRVDFEGINIEHVRDGRIAEHWSIHDALTLFHQLGRLG